MNRLKEAPKPKRKTRNKDTKKVPNVKLSTVKTLEEHKTDQSLETAINTNKAKDVTDSKNSTKKLQKTRKAKHLLLKTDCTERHDKKTIERKH